MAAATRESPISNDTASRDTYDTAEFSSSSAYGLVRRSTLFEMHAGTADASDSSSTEASTESLNEIDSDSANSRVADVVRAATGAYATLLH